MVPKCFSRLLVRMPRPPCLLACAPWAVLLHSHHLSPLCMSTGWPPLPLKLCHLGMCPSGRPVPAGSGLRQALWPHRRLILVSLKFLSSSSFSLSPMKANTSTWWISKVFVCFCWNFEISNIYLNNVSHNLGVIVMGLFCFYSIYHKKPDFFCKCL